MLTHNIIGRCCFGTSYYVRLNLPTERCLSHNRIAVGYIFTDAIVAYTAYIASSIPAYDEVYPIQLYVVKFVNDL